MSENSRIIIGFTGTRKGMTENQLSQFRHEYGQTKPKVFVHGGADGADKEAHLEAIKLTKYIEVFPGSRDKEIYWRNHFSGALVLSWQQPLLRNQSIVNRCDRLIACPAEYEEQLRSGTWSTIRYARKAGKSITIIFPDGSIRQE